MLAQSIATNRECESYITNSNKFCFFLDDLTKNCITAVTRCYRPAGFGDKKQQKQNPWRLPKNTIRYDAILIARVFAHCAIANRLFTAHDIFNTKTAI